MTESQRCLCRNAILGFLSTFLCYLCYSSLLSANPGGHSGLANGLLVTSCSLSASMGFVLWVSDSDPPFFQYLMTGARIALITTLLPAFLGLLLFQWWGFGISFVAGIWASIGFVRLAGPDKLVDTDDKDRNYFYEMVDYYSRGMRIPSAIIPPLALLGVFLFQWWGLGAGIILGGLISTLSLTLWGAEKPKPPELSPEQPAQTECASNSIAHQQVSTSLPVAVPAHPNTTVVTFSRRDEIHNGKQSQPYVDKSELFSGYPSSI